MDAKITASHHCHSQSGADAIGGGHVTVVTNPFRHTLVMIVPETSAEGNLRLPPLARERSGVIHLESNTTGNPAVGLETAEFDARVKVNQRRLAAEIRPTYDFIVCRSGSSGSVVAGRLAERLTNPRFYRRVRRAFLPIRKWVVCGELPELAKVS